MQIVNWSVWLNGYAPMIYATNFPLLILLSKSFRKAFRRALNAALLPLISPDVTPAGSLNAIT